MQGMQQAVAAAARRMVANQLAWPTSSPQTNHVTHPPRPAERIARVGFRMFLNVTASVANWNAEGTECSLVSARLCLAGMD